MKIMTTLATGIVMLSASASILAADKTAQTDTYQQAYAIHALYHPENKQPSAALVTQQYTQDYAVLFANTKKVTAEQFAQFEQARLDPVLKQRREMSLKQAHVRYGILDKSKDQKLTLKEFQASGEKTFDGFDQNQDGLINAEDTKLAGANTETHDGFRAKLPISMPMPSNVNEFIAQYGQGKNYVTLGDYLTARDKQYFETDTNQDLIVTEQEYVDEFMQRFDRNLATGTTQMQEIAGQQFKAIAKGKTTIQANDIKQYAKKVGQASAQ